MKKLIGVLIFSLYISGCSILYKQERNVPLNSLTNVQKLPSSKTSVYFTNLNGKLNQRRFKNNDVAVVTSSNGIYLLYKLGSSADYSIRYAKYSVSRVKSEDYFWKHSDQSFEEALESRGFTQIEFQKKDPECRRYCDYEGFSVEHGLHLVVFTGGYERKREGTNSDLFVEYIDYSERVKQVNNAIAQYQEVEFQDGFLPTQLISPSLVKKAISSTKSATQLQALQLTLNSLNYSSFNNRLSKDIAGNQFDDQYRAALKGSHADRKRFLARYSYSQSNANCYYVKANTLNIRKSDYSRSKKVGEYKKNDRVCATKETSKWVRSDRGWVFKQYLTTEPFSGAGKKLALIASMVDKHEYSKAKKSHTIAAYRAYRTNYPSGKFVQSAIEQQVTLYRQQQSFDGFMQAYKLQSQQADLISAQKAIDNSQASVDVEPSLVQLYFTKMINNRNVIPSFHSRVAKMNGVAFNGFIDDMLKLPSIKTEFTHDSFFDSIEYQYLLKDYKPQVTAKYQLNLARLILEYKNKKIRIDTDANCEYSRSESNTRDRGVLESLLTFNGDDKQTSYYDIYDCELSNTNQSHLNDFLNTLNNYQPTASVTKLGDKWEANKRTASYTYSTYTPPAGSSTTTYEESSSSNSSSSTNSSYSSPSSSSSSSRSGVKRIASNGKISGVSSWRVECYGGSDYIIYNKSGTWYRGGSGHMGNRYNSWSKEQVGASLCD